jgi:mRNA interferase RelE/StbE
MTYQVTFRASAEKSLSKLPRPIQAKMIRKAAALSDDPRPSGSKKLSGPASLWRIRVGDWRMVYFVDDSMRIVDIRIVAHRKDVYRGL